MKRWIVLLYGVINYVITLGVLAYAVGFIGGFLTPTRLDGPATTHPIEAILVNSFLVAIFGLQHSVMARPGFKRWWTKMIPQSMERGTYMLATNLALVLMFWFWQPMGGVIWNAQDSQTTNVLWGLYALGWLTVLFTTVLINHFDLFGLRHVWLYFRGKEYTPLRFVTPGPYRFVRHPLYVGWLLVFWATPTMTAAHLVFALGMTVYILIAIQYEERDLVEAFAGYAEYRRQVPMLVPRLFDGAHDQHATTSKSPEAGANMNLAVAADRE